MAAKEGYQTHHIDVNLDYLRQIKLRNGTVTEHVDKGLTMLFNWPFTVYKITESDTGKFYIWYYNHRFEVEDPNWHFVHTRGNDSLGHYIRDRGPEYFKFEPLMKLNDEKLAKQMVKVLRKAWTKKGFDSWDY